MSQQDTDLAFYIAQTIELHKAVNPSLNVAHVLAQVSAYFMLDTQNHVSGDEFGAELQHQLQEAGK